MGKNILIGIGGGTGSGKTSFAREIGTSVDSKEVALIQQDSYYKDFADLNQEELAKINYDHPFAFETELLVEHLKKIKANVPVETPIYDYVNHRRKEETRLIRPVRVIILEGILVLEDKRLRELMDIKIFVDTDADIRLIRRLKRDIKDRGRDFDSVIGQYLKTVRPMHMEFVEKSKRYADVIVPGGINTQAIEMVVARLKEVLHEERVNEEFVDEE